MINTVIFVRVSTADQTLDRQVEELTALANFQGWNVVKIIREVGSGSTAIEKRKAIDDLKNSVTELKASRVLVSEISRIGRTTSEALSVVDFMTKRGLSVYEYQRKIETLNEDGSINPVAELILSVLASVARMEKAQLVTRIKSGMASARRKSIHCGRPQGSTKPDERFLAENRMVVRSLKGEKLSVRKTAKLYGVSVSTVMKVKTLITG